MDQRDQVQGGRGDTTGALLRDGADLVVRISELGQIVSIEH